ncbi:MULTISPECIES: hypothetical protein [unclassified Agrobacterium]
MRQSHFIDVPVKKPWVKRWLYRAFKASIVVGCVGFVANAWINLDRYQGSLKESATSELGYRCAATLSDDTLSKGMNIYGNIDISKLGCTASTFIVSMPEVRDVRAGKIDFSPYYKPFYWQESFAAALFAFILSIIVLTGAIVSVAIVRWIWI